MRTDGAAVARGRWKEELRERDLPLRQEGIHQSIVLTALEQCLEPFFEMRFGKRWKKERKKTKIYSSEFGQRLGSGSSSSSSSARLAGVENA